jgi:hypothetical protein
MSRRFGGWPEEAFDVLLRLEGDPPAAVREGLREERERLVREPMVALMRDLADEDAFYRRFTVHGFHKLAEPWQRQIGFVRPERHVDQRVILDLDGLSVEGSGWYFDPGSYTSPQREAFLAAAEDETSGSDLASIIDTLQKQGYDVTGTTMRRIPKSYPPGHPRARLLRQADHPRAELLRLRSLEASRHLGSGQWLHSPEAEERVLEAFEELRTMTSWYTEHVPPAR